VELKSQILSYLGDMGYKTIDLGTNSDDSVDYPDYGHKAAEEVLSGNATRAIVICGSGIGISIAANRHPGIRAALCCNATMAQLAREHNNANILALGARMVGQEEAKACVDAFLTTEFAGGRHQNRVQKLA
jgi:ribose 5-phosphate isomerase B